MTTRRCYNCMKELGDADQICPDCGYDNSSPSQPAQALRCGTVLRERYLIGKMLGQGGFGITYIGYDYTLDTTVCIKEFFPAGGAMRGNDGSGRVYWSAGSTGAARLQEREVFVKEAQKAVKLRNFASVVKVWDVFYENETAYIVMEYIEGVTLKQYLVKRGAVMGAEECLDLLLPVIGDLKGVHDSGIVHRDISPDNLMIREDGKVVLLDLGAAKDMSKGSGQSSMMVAKKGFSPPEQYTEGMSIGPWTDVYAICATIYWCMTGKLLPEAMERMLGDDALKFPDSIPEVLRAVLRHGLELKPANRIKDMEELESGLKTALGKTTITITPPQKPKVPQALGVILLIAVVILVIAIPRIKNALSSGTGSETAQEEQAALSNSLSKDKFTAWAGKTAEEVIFENTLDGAPPDAEDLSETGDRGVLGWKDGRKLYIASEGGVRAPIDCSFLFSDKAVFEDTSTAWMNLTAVTNAEYLDLSHTKSTAGMFAHCEFLSTLDVSSWDTSNVTNMFSMFNGCSNLRSLDVSSWDTSNVTNMFSMFNGCGNLRSLDVSSWDTSNVTNMYGLFMECVSLTELDVSRWDTSKVINMANMFYGCGGLTELDVSNWNTSKVTEVTSMFYSCKSLKSLDVSSWDISNVLGIDWMFNDCSGLENLDVSKWNTSKFTSMSSVFSGCGSLKSLDVSGWDVSGVTNLSYLFMGCTRIKELDVSKWDTSNATSMAYMFFNCSSLSTLDVSGWDTSKVTDMQSMFWKCSNLTNLDVSNWDTSNLVKKDDMFTGTRWENNPPF